MSDSKILIEEHPSSYGSIVAKLILNAEKSLNAIDLPMIREIYQQLRKWQHDQRIRCIWLEGSGEKAFCAGGDIRQLYHSMQEFPHGPNHYAEAFFTEEYQLDYLLHTYPKPVICWGNGVVMGGGLGLMMGATHRIVTEKSRIAMPEISIGLYPDVGGTWFLNRMPHRLGLFVGLTGVHLNAADCLHLELAQRYLPSETRTHVFDAVVKMSWSEHPTEHHLQVFELLKSLAEPHQLTMDSPIKQHESAIVAAMDHAYLPEICEAIHQLAANDNPWLKKASETLKKGSPTTAHLVYQQLRCGKYLSLKEVFMLELIMSVQCALHLDFREGVRALLIDKDLQPRWTYSAIDAVPAQCVDEHFVAPWKGQHPLSAL